MQLEQSGRVCYMNRRPNQPAAANRHAAGQSDGSDNLAVRRGGLQPTGRFQRQSRCLVVRPPRLNEGDGVN
jgi:hypothetical protein